MNCYVIKCTMARVNLIAVHCECLCDERDRRDMRGNHTLGYTKMNELFLVFLFYFFIFGT